MYARLAFDRAWIAGVVGAVVCLVFIIAVIVSTSTRAAWGVITKHLTSERVLRCYCL
jgi:hypothetical protein